MKYTFKKILICGGSGFIGSHFIRYLFNKYPLYKLFNLDLLTYAGNPENLRDVETQENLLPPDKKRYFFIKGDINDKTLLSNLFTKQFDLVVNFAAESHVDRSILCAAEFIRTNVQGAYVLLDAVYKSKIPRYIYISTDEVYGSIPAGTRSDENYPLRPTNPYAASKASADLMVQSYIKTHKVPAIILRGSNNCGSHQYPEKLHPLAITSLIEGKKIPVHGKGNHIRSWIDVEDFCEALDLIMHKAEIFKIYNISGEEKTNLDVIKIVADTLGTNYKKCINFVPDRSAPDFRYSPDDTKIVNELGWKRKRSYNMSIKQMVQWYVNNEKWWKDIKKKKEYYELYKAQATGSYF